MIFEQFTPLSSQQSDLLLKLVNDLSNEQLYWVKGYLAGISTGTAQIALPATMPAATTTQQQVTIVYGSQTGHSATVAEAVKTKAAAAGFKIKLYAMGDYPPARLKHETLLLVVVSTQGEGEPPDDARELHEFLHASHAPQLENLRYAVLALGDSSYVQFCHTGREFDEQLATLGAQRLRPRLDCDLDFEDDAQSWADDVLNLLAKVQATETGTPVKAASVELLPPAPGTGGYSRKNPFAATLAGNIKLSGRGSGKQVHHLEWSLDGSGLSYEPGDALGVMAQNDPHVVAELITLLGLAPDAIIGANGDATTVEEALTHHYEITTISRAFLEKYAALTDASELKKLSQPDNEAELRHFMAGRQIIDVITHFPARGINAADLVHTLRRLPPRLYSIASSATANPDMVHLTVAAVRYTAHGRTRNGVASTHLANRLTMGDCAPVYIERNRNFKLPTDDATPVIMVGPGTGVAPFRAFIEEREATGASGLNWLFFGDRCFRTDFLYQREWQRYLKAGVLSRIDLAFSRDGHDKHYVQHRMLDRGPELYRWLQDGAHFYVCGAERMARDVHATLTDIVRTEGGHTSEAASEYVRNLQRQKRYQRDVY